MRCVLGCPRRPRLRPSLSANRLSRAAMNVLLYLVPIALALGLRGLAAFPWSLRDGQYEDMDGAALRLLSADDLKRLHAMTTSCEPRAPPKAWLISTYSGAIHWYRHPIPFAGLT